MFCQEIAAAILIKIPRGYAEICAECNALLKRVEARFFSVYIPKSEISTKIKRTTGREGCASRPRGAQLGRPPEKPPIHHRNILPIGLKGIPSIKLPVH